MLSLIQLLDDEKCFKVVRELRWPDGVNCPHCHAPYVVKQGRDDTQRFRQRYRCLNCQRKFDDLTGTVFAGHHQPLRQWVAFLVRAAPMTTLDRCLYLMGLNLSNRQIAHELGLNEDDAQDMTRSLRQGVVDASTTPTLAGTVEIDEVYLTAGHKGQNDLVKKNIVLDADGD
ncbi:transposase [Deinococcus sp. 6GRE01]|uniref:transposase n=1 Tax=Deinococcus sp. 6GRE01 TaxID=2745873 RepID=UPI001E5960C9|nr:transposase [Deinococcus sp. 6GRE01]